MAEKTPRRAAPQVGPIRAITFTSEIRCGSRTLPTNRTFIPSDLNMEVFIDDERDCLWVGYDGNWTRVPHESTGYISYWPAKAAPLGELPPA